MSVINHKSQTMTSLHIAEITGKRHDAVLRDIRNLLEQGVDAHNFVETSYTDKANRQSPCYMLTKKGCLILASGYDAKLRERIIDRWEELEVEKQQIMSPTPTPSNPQLAYVQTQLYLADALADRLRLNDASRLGMYQSIAAPYNLALPQYVESKGVTKSARDLLKEIGSPISAVKFNMLLVEQGYLETMTRPTSGGEVKKFKNITEKGLVYGKNLENPRNQKETQPHWYADKFRELYNLVVA
ncbi:MAG: Rha family transcriptional regulator [Paramuribaculum sp.]|nr:Rha family transcriptional regulator [Paramuribaculum sp.]